MKLLNNALIPMNSKARFFTLGLLLALLAFPVQSVAQSRVGTTAATFLTLGTGARGQGLGHAYTAVARGGDALFWNPAGAAIPYEGSRGSVFLTHHEWLAGINYNAGGVVIPVMNASVVGISMAVLDYGDQDVRTVAFPNGTGETFSSTDLSLGLTYAQSITPTFYFGGSVKYIRQQIRDMAASTLGFDFGFVLQTPFFQGIELAAAIQNFGGKMTMAGVNGQVFVDIDETNSGNNPNTPASIDMASWDLPLSFKFGISMVLYEQGGIQLIAVGDANQSNDNNLNSDVGGILHYGNKTFNIDLRAGYKDLFLDNVDSHLTFGGGLDVLVSSVRFGFDYAYTPFDLLGDTQMIDFRVYF